MARTSSYTYDPKTGEWTKSSTNNSSSSANTSSNRSSSSKKSSSKSSSSSHKSRRKSSSGNLTSTSSSKNSSIGSTEKKYNTIELNTLEGTLQFIVTKETIKLKAGDTVKLKGIGKYLSGNYYVKDVTHQISSNGYSHSATLIKTDFGKSLKTSTSTNKKKKAEKKKKVASSNSSTSNKRTYTVKKGDCLWNIAKKYYGSGSAYTKIYDANTNKIANPSLIYVGQKLIIP